MTRTGTIKICGLSTEATLEAALEAGTDLVGFVFFPKSPRHVALDLARDLGDQARGRARIVALCVDPDDKMLDPIIVALQPHILQLHGQELPERVAAIKRRFGVPVMKAIGIASAADLAQVPAYALRADSLLFDARPLRDAALPGGNGRAFDWTLLQGLDLAVPHMLSGGLDPGNVGAAIRITRAPGVDVSSGVESAPGVKDAGLIAAFVRNARAAFEKYQEQT